MKSFTELLVSPITLVFMLVVVLILHFMILPCLKKVWEAWTNRPTHRLRICTVNGTTGVVRARDYTRNARRFWKMVRSGTVANPGMQGLKNLGVGPIALYAPKGDGKVVGTNEQLDQLLTGCEVERREFHVVASWVLGPDESPELMHATDFYTLVHPGRRDGGTLS